MDYVTHIALLIGVFVALAVSLDLMVGSLGVAALSHAAFAGIGAYAYAVLGRSGPPSLLLALAIAIGVALVVAAVTGALLLRVRHETFILVTLGLQGVAVGVFTNWDSLTGGPLGISSIPFPSCLGWVLTSKVELLLPVAVIAAVAFGVRTALVTAPFGRVLRAARESTVLPVSVGKNVGLAKLITFCVSGCLAAAAGCVYAPTLSFIAPSSFAVGESLFVLVSVILGGPGLRFGPVLGVVALIAMGELFRAVGLSSISVANVLQIAYGIALAVVLWIRPISMGGGRR